MRQIVGALFAIVVSCSLITGRKTGQGPQSEGMSVAKPLRPAIRQIKAQTTIPILLPSKLPATWTKRTLFASGRGSDDGYRITVSSSRNCGTNFCFVGLFEAKREGPRPRPFEIDKTVLLTRAIKGYYTA
jgi:hypothetical protein